MYLSRLLLNPRSRSVQRDLAHPHELHRTICSAFPEDMECTDERALYRVDQSQKGELVLLVQSQHEPDWSQLPSQDYLLSVGEGNPALKAIDLKLQTGQRLVFRLRANPTKRMGKRAAYDKGKRVGLYKIEDQLAWLQRKASDHGFTIHSVMPIQQRRIDGRIPIKQSEKAETDGEKSVTKQHHDAKFFSVQFDGILQVTDPDLFLAAIQSGIGSGKAFGFGLLSVAPVRDNG